MHRLSDADSAQVFLGRGGGHNDGVAAIGKTLDQGVRHDISE